MNLTKITLREKQLTNGRISLYLDYYPPITHPNTGKKSRREFLKLYIFERPKGTIEREHNRSTLALAESIRSRRQLQLQEGAYGFLFDHYKETDFLQFFKDMIRKRSDSEGNLGNWMSVFKHLKNFRPGGIAFGDIDENFLEKFKQYLKRDLKLSQNSQASYYSKLSAALKEAERDGILKDNPTKRVKAVKHQETKREFLTLEEIKVLSQTPCRDETLKRAFLFSAFTGLRYGDIRDLRWKDIHENGQHGAFIRFRQNKTKGEETLPLPSVALKQLGSRKSREALVFKELKYTTWNNQILKEWVAEAGIYKHITFHCARHSFATLQLSLGTDIYTVSKLLGHKDLKTTQIYTRIIDQKKVEAANRLNDLDL
jgi:integrase